MNKYILIFILFIFINCNSERDLDASQLENEIINSVLIDLIRSEEIYLSFEGFKSEMDLSIHNAITEDSLSRLYTTYLENRLLKKIVLKEFLVPLTQDEEKAILGNKFSLEFNLQNKALKINYDLDDLKNRGEYEIIKQIDFDSLKLKKDVIHMSLSRLYFNKKKNHGVFVNTIFCGELCYKKELVYVKKNNFDNWKINSRDVLNRS